MSSVEIYLKEISDEDIPLFVKWRNSANVSKWFIYKKPFTIDSQREWMRDNIKTGKAVQYIIFLKETNVPIGAAYIRDIDKINRKGEYGILIGENEYWGKGIGTTAAKMLIQIAFKQLHLHKLFLRVISSNIIATKSYEKAGFKLEALLKDEIYIDNKYDDIKLMAIINNDDSKK